MNNNNVSGVLFDLDGTLLDTANDLGEALNHVLITHGLPTVKREHYRPVASDGALGLLTLGFGDKLKDFNFDTLRNEFLEFYQSNIAVHTCLYSEIEMLIDTLDNAQIPWGIVTNKPEQLTALLLPHFATLNSSKIMVGGDTLPQRKPDPTPILYACEKMNIDANKAIYVGDAPRDIEAGNAAGLFTAVALWGYISDQQQCSNWQANIMVSNPSDILKITL